MKFYRLKLYIKYLPGIRTMDRLYNRMKFIKQDQKKQIALKEQGKSAIKVVELALTELGIKHFVYFGNLLGIIRDGRFMEYDDDLDYGIIIEKDFSWDNLEKDLTRYNLRKIRQFSFDGFITEQTYAFADVTIDIFGCYFVESSMNSYLYFRKEGYIYNSKYDYHVGRFDYTKVIGTHKIVKDGITYTVPVNAEELLESIYSESWRIPDKNWDHTKGRNFHELNTIGCLEYFG